MTGREFGLIETCQGELPGPGNCVNLHLRNVFYYLLYNPDRHNRSLIVTWIVIGTYPIWDCCGLYDCCLVRPPRFDMNREASAVQYGGRGAFAFPPKQLGSRNISSRHEHTATYIMVNLHLASFESGEINRPKVAQRQSVARSKAPVFVLIRSCA